MAHLLRRWRAPLLAGIGVWLLSFPLLTSHAAPATRTAYARTASVVDVEAGDHRLFQELGRERRAALAAAEAAMAAAIPAPPKADPVAVIVRPAAPAPAAPAVRANTIVIPRLGLRLAVGWYSDCLGRAAVPRWGAWRWSCAGANNTYIMAHNPGTFTPILGLRAGDIVKYGDPSGVVHTYRVSYTTIVSNTQLWPLGATDVTSLTLQTCWTWDGSRDFIVRATQI
jgi:hypothetical protein